MIDASHVPERIASPRFVAVRSHVGTKMPSRQNVQSLQTDSADSPEKAVFLMALSHLLFSFHLGSCQSLSNQKVWCFRIHEPQADGSGWEIIKMEDSRNGNIVEKWAICWPCLITGGYITFVWCFLMKACNIVQSARIGNSKGIITCGMQLM